MPAEAQHRLKVWREERGLPMPLPKAEAAEWAALVNQLKAEATVDYAPGEEPFESAGDAQQRAIDEADEHMAQVGP